MLRLCAWLLLATVGSGIAFAACAPERYAQELELTGLGVVYMGDFRFDSARDEAVLFNGICFVSASEPRLTLTAPTMRVERVQTEPTFVAAGATVTLQRFTLYAERLSGNAEGLGLQNLSLMSPQFSGSAVRARYTLQGGRTILTGVKLRLGDFRVESAAAGLTQTTLVLQNARATTCTCEGGGLYTLAAPSVAINLQTGVARVEGGVLETLGLRLALDPNLRLLLDGAPQAQRGRVNVGGAALLPTPAAPEPVGVGIDEGAKVAVPIQLFPGAALELGLAGLDDAHPLGLVSLLNLNVALGGSRVRAALGRVGPGGRADVLLRTPLAPGVGLDLSTANRDWQEAGFLHEVALGLYGGRQLRGVLGDVADTLVLGGRLFTALSRQTLAGSLVRSPRLGLLGRATYTTAPTPLGTFALRTESELTYYPGVTDNAVHEDMYDDTHNRAQLGVRLVPSWRRQAGPLRASLELDHQAVFGRSPFAVSLDRLQPRSVADASVAWAWPNRTLTLQGRYAFTLADAFTPVRRVRLEAAQTLPLGGVTLHNRLSAEVAGLFGPADPEVDAFVSAETRFEFSHSELELGFKTRYDLLPEVAGLNLLEVYTSYPFTLGNVTLRPFVALNAAPLLTERPLPGVTGYGLSVAYRSCCGTLVASYRLHDQTAKTAFDVRLAPDPEVTDE